MKKFCSFVMMFLGGYFLGKRSKGNTAKKELLVKSEHLDKQLEFYQLLIAWLEIKQRGESLEKYFKNHNYKTVAIYGMRELGERLYDELEKTNIHVDYTIDKNLAEVYKTTKYKTRNLNDEIEDVDVIVVTAIHYYSDIYVEVSKYSNADIVSLEDVVYEIV